GDELDKMSGRVGASVEFLSALSHAAAIGGTDIAAMEVGIRRLQRSAYDATQELSTAVDAFKELRINIRGADGQLKSTEALFMESAAALAKMENNTKKAALATVIFGRAGTKLLPMLKNGADGLVEVMEEARRLGIVMSTEDATAAAELTDAWTRLTSVLKMAVARVGGALAPRLTELAGRITQIVRPVIDWIRQNAELIVSVAKIGLVLTAAGAGLIVLGGALSGLGTAFGALATVAAGVGTALGVVGTVLGAILSPVGLVATAVASLAGYFLYASGAG
ncbi:MAG: phage tail tape measure protein, partial [Clostridiales bacterium]|nr:phage tail tape measure protein [Clostridiales bacterium]